MTRCIAWRSPDEAVGGCVQRQDIRVARRWHRRISCRPCNGNEGYTESSGHRCSNRSLAWNRNQALDPLAGLNVQRSDSTCLSPQTLRSSRRSRNCRRSPRRSARESKFHVTRLTIIKSLCAEPEAATAFALFLAQKIQKKMRQRNYPQQFRELVDRAIKELEALFG